MARLRRLTDGVLLTLYTRYTAKELPALCRRLGLPTPSEGNTKHERLVASLNACPDDRLSDIAEAVTVPGPPKRPGNGDTSMRGVEEPSATRERRRRRPTPRFHISR